MNKKKPASKALLAWYDRHRRVLPWRALPGQVADPYHVWLSEIMLQQTTVAAVGPYFLKFLKRWPTIESLAASDLDHVLQMWAGLGYYRRARGLHACAQVITHDYGGVFPTDEKQLLKLPGLGPYTVAAIRSIAFDQKANVVDGNVERVMARLFNVQTPLPKAKKELTALASDLLPSSRYGDYAQALMDLGATVCTPKSPKCGVCPFVQNCLAFASGAPQDLPLREPKKEKPVRRGFAFVAFSSKGEVFLRQREDTGLLAGMMEVPSTQWVEKPMPKWAKAVLCAPFKAEWILLDGMVYHTFTHFDLELSVAIATMTKKGRGLWVAKEALEGQALPSVMRKILRHAYKGRKEEDHA